MNVRRPVLALGFADAKNSIVRGALKLVIFINTLFRAVAIAEHYEIDATHSCHPMPQYLQR